MKRLVADDQLREDVLAEDRKVTGRSRHAAANGPPAPSRKTRGSRK